MVGRTLSHYRITAQLGAGGLGVVYRGEDTRLGREVAVKFVSDEAGHGEQAVIRLRSEARAASSETNLTATSRPSRVSSPRYTTPMPPAPS